MDAVPLLRVAEPRALEPSRNEIMPVELAGDTVAVSVTLCPALAGLGTTVRVTVGAFTVRLTAVELAPENVAVSECVPAARVDVRMTAEPLARSAVPSVVIPSRKVTVPLELAGVTEAVRVTFWPRAAGLGEAVSATVMASALTT